MFGLDQTPNTPSYIETLNRWMYSRKVRHHVLPTILTSSSGICRDPIRSQPISRPNTANIPSCHETLKRYSYGRIVRHHVLPPPFLP